ncbi:MAG: hypothetical protein KatS3mg051_1059 [Anaerolineae bacterium]|nr:MAG: hypothetical protein KatS3mg051_1059 [Anaerolineae bacterium]
MKVLRREWFDVSRADEFRIIPLGDIHVGARGSDTAAFRHVVEDIASDERAYWIGMGDYLDAINRSDPRFSPGILADWFTVPHAG